MNFTELDKLDVLSRQSRRKSVICGAVAVALLLCFGVFLILLVTDILPFGFILIPAICGIAAAMLVMAANNYFKQALRYDEAFLKKFYEETEKDRW